MREDWIDAELQEVFETVTGNTPSKIEIDNYGHDIPFIKPPDITNSAINSISEYLSNKGKLKARVLPSNSVLITCIGNLGRVGFNKDEVAFNQQINAILPTDFIDFKFTFYQAQSGNFRNQLESLSTSTTVALVNKSSFNSVKIDLAPLPIQRAIVSKIEALFSDLDNGIANFKIAQGQLKIYRQAVLKKAFKGHSTITTIGDEFDFIGGGTPSKQNSEYWNGDLFWCSVKDVKGDYLLKTIDKITLKGLNESAANLAKPDNVILITRISPGKTIISRIETAINQDLKVVKPKKEYLPKLIHYLFQAFEREIIKLSSGTTVLGINLTNLKSINIPLLDISEQTQIVQEIESRLSVCDKVEQSINESIIKAEALRQSILKKAFEGKLLNQSEIELCKTAADYEPASELLKKIKAEKLAKEQEQKKVTTKKKSKK